MNLRQKFIPHALAAGLSLSALTGHSALAQDDTAFGSSENAPSGTRALTEVEANHAQRVCEYHIAKSHEAADKLQHLFQNLRQLPWTIELGARQSLAFTARSLLDEQIRNKNTVEAYARTLQDDGRDVEACDSDYIAVTPVPDTLSKLIERYDI